MVPVRPCPSNRTLAFITAKGEYTARYGFCAGIYIKRWTTLFWGVTALILIVIYGSQVSNPDYIWGVATRDLLGPLGIGLVGLMIACLMAALMSTADCLMITTSGLITHNILKPFFPGYSERFYVWMGRISGAVFIVNCVIIAYMFDNIFDMIKLLWEFNISVAASFWLGMKWRRANKIGAWCSMLSTLVIFTILPLIIPLFSTIRTNEYLGKTIESVKIARIYTARNIDVVNRQNEIELWEKLNDKGLIETDCPELLIAGNEFEKEYLTSPRSIFWSQDLRQDDDGLIYGKGMLFLELVLLDKIGFDLSANPYALNETIRFSIRMIWPFLILIIVSRLTRSDDKIRLDRFYVKMKTPVSTDKEKDKEEMQISYKSPDRFDHNKMFPNTNWEFEKFDKTDMKGIIGYTIAGMVILLAVYMVSLIGI